MRHHHVGVACRNIERTAEDLCKMFGAERGETIFDPIQNAELCMLQMADGTQVELVSGPVVETYIKKRTTYYHICYETDDLTATIDDLKSKGAVVVSPPNPAVLFGGRKVAFLFTPMGLVELLEAEA